MLRWLLGLVLLIAVAFGAAYVVAGRGAPPHLTIDKPERVVGQAGTLEVTAEAPNARFTTLAITLEQNGKSYPLVDLTALDRGEVPPGATGRPDEPNSLHVAKIARDQLRVSRALGKATVPQLVSGPARIVVTATRPSFLKLRQLTSTATKDFQVRLERPRIAVVSTHHYVNHGGSEFVVYRATPPDVLSGVRVGDVEYRGYPVAGAGVTGAGPEVKGAFFALLWDQDLNTRIIAFARDEAGNEATATFVDNVFEKPQKKSTIPIDDRFIQNQVPDIIANSPELKMNGPSGDLLADFLKVNGELRKINTDEIAAFDKKTSDRRLWSGPFVQLGNSKVEASFADHRTYMYNGKEVDHQVHLGFDLAVTTHTPVHAANDGVVLNAAWLGIYGNCVILDHGMGVQSLYGHLQSFDVKVGDQVKRGQQLGLSDTTGLAGGDHLHFTMLIGGRMVNPVEWWDPHWIADRVDRKLNEISSGQQTR